MNFYFLASLIIFVLVLSRVIARHRKTSQKKEEAFWARERQANSVRRKSLEGLNYIRLPLESLPTKLLTDNSQVKECLDILNALSKQPIVNLTGYSNTDLKLEYGTANITSLSEFDQNYTLLARTLQKWANALFEAGYQAEGASVLEFAVSTGTDISASYYCLADYYSSLGEHEKIRQLTASADALRSANGKIIVRKLQESYP